MSTNELAIFKKKIEELQEDKKRLKEKLAEVEQERIEYLQNVSHQLVAPLNAIKWHIENLTNNRVNKDRALIILRSIYSQATLAVHLAKNFNLMSNLDADHELNSLKEPLQKVNLFKLLINLANDFQPLAFDKKITIKVDQRKFDEKPDVFVIKQLVGQVFSNIIENAVKYSYNESDIIIRGNYNEELRNFQVEIINKGIPIRTDVIEKIFERGFRSKEALKKYPAGTGFGLYIAKKIVDIHEGKITSNTNKGLTIFRVILPINIQKEKIK